LPEIRPKIKQQGRVKAEMPAVCAGVLFALLLQPLVGLLAEALLNCLRCYTYRKPMHNKESPK